MRSSEEIGDELYTLPPADFTAARDAAVARARADGDAATARQVASLKRPTQGAFLVNLLALRRPEVVTELIDLGERIRAAQAMTSGPPTHRPSTLAADLRALTAERRSALQAALATCRTLAVEAGASPPSEAQLAEAEATLAAAMADPAAAEQVRAGRVVKALSYAGFGAGVGLTSPLTAAGRGRAQPRAVPPGATGEPAAPSPGQPCDTGPADAELERQRREAERAAWERLARAEAGLAVAQSQERTANEELDRIADEITRLRSALDAASQRARAARTARQAAERELAAARREVDSTR